MTVLIIGNKGFIGSFLTNILSSKHEVWGCDIIQSSETNYFEVLAESPDYQSPLRKIKFDFCINCAGSASVQNSINNPFDDFNLNLSNLGVLLDAIVKTNQKCKIINISSAAVYGNPLSLPVSILDESNPISPYGVHKLLAENLLLGYSRIFGIQTCSVRIFSAYGNGQKKLFLWDCFQKLVNTANGQEVSFYGTGYESRDFIHISDIARQIELVMENAFFKGESYNIANGEEVYIKDIVTAMQRELNNSATVFFTGQVRLGDPLNWKADITPMLKWGYKKTVSIQDGIKDYVKWAKGNV